MDPIHSQPRQQSQVQQGFQPNFNCYEAFPATSPPEPQFFNPPQPGFQQGNPASGIEVNEMNYIPVNDPNQQQPTSQTQASQPYYYYQPQTSQNPNPATNGNFGYQPSMRSIPNHQIPGIQHQQSLPEHMDSHMMQQIPHSAIIQNNHQQKRKEIYRYIAPHELYSCSWSVRPDSKFRLAVGSFIEEYNNKISIVQLKEDHGDFATVCTFDHPYPSTKIMFIPDPKGIYPDLLATTGDYLRLWKLGGHNGASLEVMLNNNRTSDYCAPLTSSDWNETDLSLIGTSSIDTTCTIWQIETGQAIGNTARAIEGTVKTQLIAHDKEVYDIAFSKLATGREIFASVGADGSVRMFDLRHMEYSTIVFEEPNRKPLLRLAWNKSDHNYLATFARGSNEAYILDVRVPSMPIATLQNHSASISGIAWAPHSPVHICTAGDDSQALIWDLHNMPRPIEDPILAYAAGGAINHVDWSNLYTDWISICYGRSLELLRV